jgi:hypothetical protein
MEWDTFEEAKKIKGAVVTIKNIASFIRSLVLFPISICSS